MDTVQTVNLSDFATPLPVVERIKSFIEFPESFAALDPCCGDGSALQALVDGTSGSAYGIEQNNEQATKAKRKLTRLARGGYEGAKISHQAFSILLLSPPVAEENEKSVLGILRESRFLVDASMYLAPGGLLVFIVPRHRMNDSLARSITYRYTNLDVYRFPDGYDEHGHLVIFGIRKDRNGYEPEVQKALGMAAKVNLAPLPNLVKPKYKPVKTSPTVKIFRAAILDPEDLREDVARSAAWNTFAGMLGDDQLDMSNTLGRPPIPLHQGHIGLLLASGNLDGQIQNHLVKGRVIKDVAVVNEDGEYGKVVTTTKDVYRISVKTLQSDGKIKTLM